MPVLERTSVVWVVLDHSGEVVLMCAGTDAPSLVKEWKRRGFRIAQLTAEEVDAA